MPRQGIKKICATMCETQIFFSIINSAGERGALILLLSTG